MKQCGRRYSKSLSKQGSFRRRAELCWHISHLSLGKLKANHWNC